jgi:Rieske Fe-S protein
MTYPDDTHALRDDARREIFDPRRRRLLLWMPAAVFGSIAAALGLTAFRFLRPRADGAASGAAGPDAWLPLGPVDALNGDHPVALKVAVERVHGWASVRDERAIYVLPRADHRVVSAVCPHEQCEVVWSEGSREFLCPCHDSRFGPEGARLAGPAERDLTRLPSRVEGGVLEVLIDGDEQTGRAQG